MSQPTNYSMAGQPVQTNLNSEQLRTLIASRQLDPIAAAGNRITSIQHIPQGRPSRVEDQYRSPERIEITYYKPASQIAPSLTSKEEASWLSAYNAVKKTPSSEQTSWLGGIPRMTSFVNWEQPTKSGVPLAAIGTRPYREAKAQPNIFSLGAQQFSNRLLAPTPVTDIEFWTGDPISGKYGINPRLEGDINYGWTAQDVYNIASTTLLIGGAAIAVKGLIAPPKPIVTTQFRGYDPQSLLAWSRYRVSLEETSRLEAALNPGEVSPFSYLAKTSRGWQNITPQFSAYYGFQAAEPILFPQRIRLDQPIESTRFLEQASRFGTLIPSATSGIPFMVPSLLGLARLPKTEVMAESFAVPSTIMPIVTQTAAITPLTGVETIIAQRTSIINIPRSEITPILKPSQPLIQPSREIPIIKPRPFRIEIPSMLTSPIQGQRPFQMPEELQTPIQAQKQAPIQAQTPRQIQQQIQRQIQRSIQTMANPLVTTTIQEPRYPSDDFFRKSKRKKPKSIFQTSDRSRRFYPILTSKQFKKLMA